MAGNLEVTDLPLIPVVEGADLYAAKNNLDYRVRTGEPGGVATLDGTGKVPTSQIPSVFLPLTAGSTSPLTGNLNIAKDGPALVLNDTDNAVGLKRAVVQVHPTNGNVQVIMTTDGDAGTPQFTYDFVRANGNFSTQGRIVANSHFNSNNNTAVLSAETGNILLRPNGSNTTTNQVTIDTTGGVTSTKVNVSGGLALLGNTSGLGVNEQLINFAANRWLTYNGVSNRWQFGSSGDLEVLSGNIRTAGGGAGFTFLDRSSARQWQWYGQADVAWLHNGTTNIVAVEPSGIVTANNFIASSDRNLKDNIEDKCARSKLADKLRLVSYIWKDTGRTDQGIIAQEVQELAPEYVREVGGHLAVDKVGLLLECVVDLAARVRELEEKVNG